MAIYILDKSLKIEIYFDEDDSEYHDNICVSIDEECASDERLFRADQTNIYLTPEEACQLAQALITAARCSRDMGD